MILIDNTKYSCIECIRGHRSSLCRHHTRPLLQVRSKGRPNISTNGNPNYRIAVFAEQIQTEMTEQDQDMTGDNGGCETTNLNTEGSKKCKSKASPVVILKSSPKQVIDLVSGEIIGPYKNSNGSIVKTEANSNGSAPINGVIKQEVADQIVNIKQESSIKSCCKNDNASKCTSSDSLISKFANQNFSIPSKSLSQQGNTSSCCANKVSKSNCKCSNGSKTINKSKILRTYLQNHLMKLKDWNTNESMEQQQLQQQQREQQQQLQQQNISAYSNVFQATLLPLLNAIQQPELQFCSAPTPKIPQQQLDGDYSFNNVKQEITPRNSIEETPPPRNRAAFTM